MKLKSWGALAGLLGVALVAALVFGIGQYGQAKSARIRLEASKQRALFSVISHVESMEAGLAKVRAASSPGHQTAFLTACYSQAQAARDSLSQVAVPGVDFTNVRQFVARVGDYCQVISQRLVRGGAVRPDEWSELARLESGVKDLASALMTAAQRASRGGPKAGLFVILGLGGSAPVSPGDALSQGFSEIDALTQSIPSPVYDGPFSEKNQAMQALARPGPAVSAENARSIGLGFLYPGETYPTVSVGTSEGSIPCYLVSGKRGDGSEVMTAVAKQGGAVVWSQDGRMLGAPGIDIQAARDAAGRFLASKGFGSLRETGWRKPGPGANRVVFTFAPTTAVYSEGTAVPVLLFPDTVKLEVALDTGSVVAFDQTAYLTTHDSPARVIPSPAFSAEEARGALKPELKVADDRPRLTVIPLLPTTEALAWEFRVRQGSDVYLVYVNAMTGKEEVVLQVIEDETGTMAI
jgi:germination protein YpeB